MTKTQRRKLIRLERSLYRKPNLICSITINTRHYAQLFTRPQVANSAVSLLQRQSEMKAVAVHAFCIMPEHLHLLLQTLRGYDLCDFVGKYKSIVQHHAWSLGIQGRIWQRSFYDSFLRKETAVETVVRYILLNPVRRRLVENWREYPYSGSLTLDIDEL